jgi:hypothetical protein
MAHVSPKAVSEGTKSQERQEKHRNIASSAVSRERKLLFPLANRDKEVNTPGFTMLDREITCDMLFQRQDFNGGTLLAQAP